MGGRLSSLFQIRSPTSSLVTLLSFRSSRLAKGMMDFSITNGTKT